MNNLRSKAGKALAWDLLGNYGGQLTSFVISVFLARLLEPKDFGLVGMSMVFISVLKVFMDMGFASALVQNKNNTSLTYSSVFFLNILAGAVLTVIIFLTAPWVGRFYQNDQVGQLLQLLSGVFFISSFNVVQATILRKNLDFKSLTYRDLISQIVAGIIAVDFAFKGFGVYALVIQQIGAALINTILLWKITEWYPRWEFSWPELKKLTGFSFYVFAAQSVNQLIKQADTLIVGKLFSPTTLGFYARANSLNSLINKNSVSSITKVFFPVLSSIQDDDNRFKNVYLKLINVISGISVFITGFFFLCGEEIVIGLYGPKWESSVLIFQILIIKGFTYPISAMIVNAFMAKGKAKENFHFGNIRKVVQLVPFVIAYYYGFYPFLYALVLTSIFVWMMNNWFVSISLGISSWSQVKSILPNIIFVAVLIVCLEKVFPEGLNYFIAVTKVLIYSIIFGLWLYFSKSSLLIEGRPLMTKLWRKLKGI